VLAVTSRFVVTRRGWQVVAGRHVLLRVPPGERVGGLEIG
jgi:hypothetical protein